jgi:hypothetical protein
VDCNSRCRWNADSCHERRCLYPLQKTEPDTATMKFRLFTGLSRQRANKNTIELTQKNEITL